MQRKALRISAGFSLIHCDALCLTDRHSGYQKIFNHLTYREFPYGSVRKTKTGETAAQAGQKEKGDSR
jgi:hypothetical protein